MRSTSELREEILAAARAEFAAYGLAGSRVDRIAKAARASKERLYAHFGDKETLFRDVVATDSAEFFAAVRLRPDAIADVAGDIFDLTLRAPDLLRMITWARLEGLGLREPDVAGEPVSRQSLDAIRTAQSAGAVDPVWDPLELLTLLVGVGMAWAQSPEPLTATDEPELLARRRQAAVRAAQRIVSPSGQGESAPSA